MKVIFNNYYPLKVWFFTVIIASIIILITSISRINGGAEEAIGFTIGFLGYIIIGGLYSIPTFIIFYLIFFITKNKPIKIIRFKILLISVAIIFLTITNYLYWGRGYYNIHSDKSGLITTIAYDMAVIIAVYCFKVEKIEIKEIPTKRKPWEY